MRQQFLSSASDSTIAIFLSLQICIFILGASSASLTTFEHHEVQMESNCQFPTQRLKKRTWALWGAGRFQWSLLQRGTYPPSSQPFPADSRLLWSPLPLAPWALRTPPAISRCCSLIASHALAFLPKEKARTFFFLECLFSVSLCAKDISCHVISFF